MAGPFTGYAPPGVYTQTFLDPAIGGLLGNIRIPALIGTSEEIKKLEGYETVRGSSPSQDNRKVNENVTGFTGTNKSFTVAHFPITTGDGMGRVTTNTNDVEVKVNGEKAIVAKVDGINGVITLALPPKASDTVTSTYFYKNTDTKVVDEDLSTQASGTNTTFYTHHKPIVDGSNGGRTTTNVGMVTVKVNGAIVAVSHLDGVEGAITLATPPAGTDTVKVTYYFNGFSNTADDLPYPGLVSMDRVGLSPESNDFIENVDYAIIDNQIQWGTGYKLVTGVHTTGGEFFDENQISGTLVDDTIYNEDVSAQFTGVETSLTVTYLPIVDGTGRDIITNDPTQVYVTVNGTVAPVTRVVGETGKIYLRTAPPIGAVVMANYWRSRQEDDTYAIEVIIPGGTGVGTYKITSLKDGRLGLATPGTETVANPAFMGAGWMTGPTVAKGYTIDETVTLTFTSNTEFTVSSSDPAGSAGSGVTGSTYIDPITGLMFTLVPDASYAALDTLDIDVVKEATFIASVIPITSVPGLYLTVNNTTNVTAGDITNLVTFDKSGKEPSVGDLYYISYTYEKTSYDCALYTKFRDVTAEYGDLLPSNPLVLAAYIAFMNGAAALILCQVQKAANSETAADVAYFDVLKRLERDVDGVNPAVIFPVTTSQAVVSAVSQHCNIQSSKRNRRERISFFGFPVGTEPTEAGDIALSINSERMICVYPDGATIELVEADGTTNEHVVDGTYLAAALMGLNVSPAYDVATPMTRKVLTGFKALVRSMDETTMDQVATKGICVIEKRGASFVIRHALTTRMESTFTREIMVTTIKDFIQQEARRVLDPYIGKKFTANLTTDVSTTLASMLRSAVDATIIVDFKGVVAERDAVQPDYIKCVAFYIPIVGLNWISVDFNIRARF